MESFAEIRRTMFSKLDAAEPSHATKPFILIIDDNLDVMDSLTNVLKSHYRLITCNDYEEAKGSLRPEIRVVLLDIKMASKDGIEVYRLLKEYREELRIIFHSAYPGDSEKAAEIEQLAHHGYLTKGEYQTPDLLAAIEAALQESDEGNSLPHRLTRK